MFSTVFSEKMQLMTGKENEILQYNIFAYFTIKTNEFRINNLKKTLEKKQINT